MEEIVPSEGMESFLRQAYTLVLIVKFKSSSSRKDHAEYGLIETATPRTGRAPVNW